jgi:hypothetical protein
MCLHVYIIESKWLRCVCLDFRRLATEMQSGVRFLTFFKKRLPGLGSEPGIFCFHSFSHSTTLRLSHSDSPNNFFLYFFAKKTTWICCLKCSRIFLLWVKLYFNQKNVL